MELETDQGVVEIQSAAELSEQLRKLHPDGNPRAILSTSEEHYIQAAAFANGYVIEKREGSSSTHRHARHASGRPPLPAVHPDGAEPGWLALLFGWRRQPHLATHSFSQRELEEAFAAYFNGQPAPSFITWEDGHGN